LSLGICQKAKTAGFNRAIADASEEATKGLPEKFEFTFPKKQQMHFTPLVPKRQEYR
jgi:hypothetical protein